MAAEGKILPNKCFTKNKLSFILSFIYQYKITQTVAMNALQDYQTYYQAATANTSQGNGLLGGK